MRNHFLRAAVGNSTGSGGGLAALGGTVSNQYIGPTFYSGSSSDHYVYETNLGLSAHAMWTVPNWNKYSSANWPQLQVWQIFITYADFSASRLTVEFHSSSASSTNGINPDITALDVSGSDANDLREALHKGYHGVTKAGWTVSSQGNAGTHTYAWNSYTASTYSNNLASYYPSTTGGSDSPYFNTNSTSAGYNNSKLKYWIRSFHTSNFTPGNFVGSGQAALRPHIANNNWGGQNTDFNTVGNTVGFRIVAYK
tara:strand:- start:444 stop:1205 length:762 start_codon:yes stop_codon:yes gene_type:complete